MGGAQENCSTEKPNATSRQELCVELVIHDGSGNANTSTPLHPEAVLLPQMFPSGCFLSQRGEGELGTSQNPCPGNFVGSAPSFWLRSVGLSGKREKVM